MEYLVIILFGVAAYGWHFYLVTKERAMKLAQENAQLRLAADARRWADRVDDVDLAKETLESELLAEDNREMDAWDKFKQSNPKAEWRSFIASFDSRKPVLHARLGALLSRS